MPKRLLVAIAGSFPVAVVAAVSLGLAIYVGDAVSTIFFWIVWGASTYYAVREVELRRVFGRTAVAYAVAAFTLPMTAAVFAFAAFREVESTMNEAEGLVEGFLGILFGAIILEIFLIIAIVAGVFGIVTGIIAIFVARSFLMREGAKTPELEEGDPPATMSLRSMLSDLRRSAAGVLRRARQGDRGTVLGLGIVALLLAVITGIAIYGLLVSEDTMEPTLTIAPTPVPVPPTPGLAAAATPTSTSVQPTSGPAAAPVLTAVRLTPTPVPLTPTSAPAAAPVLTPEPAATSEPEPTFTPRPTFTPTATPDPCLRYVTYGLREAMWESADALRCVVEAGADVNAVDDLGLPVLAWAILEDDSVEYVRILVEAGADTNARDDDGNPMLYRAIIQGDSAAPELVRILAEAGADVNARDDGGDPILYWAMLQDNAVELVRILVEAGADVNARDDDDRSMLYWAAIKDNLEVVQILVDAGATE